MTAAGAQPVTAAPPERRFGPYGGRYVPETLVPTLDELEREWMAAREDPSFGLELSTLLRDYAGRPTPLVLSGGLSADNVGEAIAAVRPWAVDSASGTEARPGVKDPARLEALFRAVAAADARIEAAAA